MLVNTSENIKSYSFELLNSEDLIQGIFTRAGGVSPSPWDTLNLGGTVGDIRENVVENRRRIFQFINRPVETLFDVWQVHSKHVICTTQPRPLESPHQKADAILTNNPNVTLLMRFADCVPILLFDPVKKVVGIVHAGWQGTVRKIVQHTVQSMESTYGVRPENILAGIGPSIGPDHYEIGLDVVTEVNNHFGGDAGTLIKNCNDRYFLDLWLANQLLLEQSGVRNIQVSNICTACNLSDWYSHRGERGSTGRFGTVIALRQ